MKQLIFWHVWMNTDIDQYEYFTDIEPEIDPETWYINIDKFVANNPLQVLQILDNIDPQCESIFDVEGLLPILEKIGAL